MKITQSKDLQISENKIKGLATVEVVDAMGDIVRVDGIDLSRHTPQSPIKILANHISSDNGKPTVIGKIVKFEKTTYPHNGTSVPALGFEMEFAPTVLGNEYKQLVKEGFITDFSIGFYGEGVPMYDAEKNYTGTDFTKSTIIEVSLVSVPANQYANVIKALVNKSEDGKLDKLIASQTTLITSIDKMSKMLEMKIKEIDDDIISRNSLIGDLSEKNTTVTVELGTLKEVNHELEKRLDMIELDKELDNEIANPISTKQSQDDMMDRLSDVLKMNK